MSKKANLKTLINTVINSKREWFHEQSIRNEKNSIWDQSKCKDLITSYMSSAGTDTKRDTIAKVLKSDNLKLIDDIRYQHILITYFLGLAIYNKCSTIKEAINKEFCNNPIYQDALEKHEREEFSYLWFLICLFHDLGYQYEKDFETSKTKFPDFSALKNVTSIDDDNKTILDKFDGVPNLYKNIIENYFYLRKFEHNVYDHGIVGGMQLYYDLCDIRRRNYNNPENEEKVKNGIWKPELEKIFALAASVVICHNIFFAINQEDAKKYRMYGLSSLINTDKQYIITLQDYPVFFLFCLVDTLEPIKVVKDVDLLNKIRYDISSDKITCQINLKCGCKDRLIKNIRELDTWLCPVNGMTISIK